MDERNSSCDTGMIEWANSLARTAYCEELKRNTYALEYLTKERGFTMPTLQEFGIGYAPDSWNYVANKLRTEHNIPIDALVAAGLVIEKKGEQTHHYDRFRNRIMFPWEVRKRGEEITAGFTGRTLDSKEQAKYLNTSATPLFQKGNLLWSFDRAIRSSVEKGTIVVVEGPTDVMRAHQIGAYNFVSPCGTSLTEQHMKLIQKKLPDARVILCFDSDEAGRKATERALDAFLGYNISVAVPAVSGDPDSILSRYPLGYLLDMQEDGLEHLIRLKMENLKINSLSDAGDCTSLARAISPAFSLLAQNHPGRFGAYVDRLMQKMSASGISRDSLLGCLEEKIQVNHALSGRRLNDAQFLEVRFMQGLVYLAPRGSLRSTLDYLSEHTTLKADMTLPEAKVLFDYLEKQYSEQQAQQHFNGFGLPLFGKDAKTCVVDEIRRDANSQKIEGETLSLLLDTCNILESPKLSTLLEMVELIHANTNFMPALRKAVRSHALDEIRAGVDGLTKKIS